MPISPVSPSNNAVTTTQALKPQQAVDAVRRADRENKLNESADRPPPPQAAALKATVNSNGETIGTIVNITA
jgi:hypothetical protein